MFELSSPRHSLLTTMMPPTIRQPNATYLNRYAMPVFKGAHRPPSFPQLDISGTRQLTRPSSQVCKLQPSACHVRLRLLVQSSGHQLLWLSLLR